MDVSGFHVAKFAIEYPYLLLPRSPGSYLSPMVIFAAWAEPTGPGIVCKLWLCVEY